MIFYEDFWLATFPCCATCCQALVMFFGVKVYAALATRTSTVPCHDAAEGCVVLRVLRSLSPSLFIVVA